MSSPLPAYFYIPNSFLDNMVKEIPIEETRVLLCFYRHTLDFRLGKTNPSQAFLAEKTGLSVPEVKKTLKSLIKKDLIEELYPDCYSLTRKGV